MKKEFLFLIFLASFLRMNGNPDPCTDSLKADINKNWKFSYGYFMTTLYFTNRIDLVYTPCIIQMNKEKLIDLFGEPTIRDHSSITYRVIAVNDKGEISESNCRYIIFYFDEKDDVQGYQGYYK